MSANSVLDGFQHHGINVTKLARYCAVSLDCDLYDPMKSGLDFFYPRLNRGGILFLHDYSSGHWPGSKKAIDEFCNETGEMVF
jgi:hypothetical protein